MNIRVEVYSWMVEIHYNPEGDWQADKIYIYDPQVKITEEEIYNIIDYIYSEGFIEDRRTPYEIVRIEY